ncbi:hypothetical protein [Thioalkalivibrio sp. HK1]|uniref:hypothetical protein n=1 Tax=Thioalkalivibrio sp. HK1 TaxID=1469245 RepID=UPI0004AF35F4|nr:hypothetical protein [Thioalkalivibrio sp. HK1]
MPRERGMEESPRTLSSSSGFVFGLRRDRSDIRALSPIIAHRTNPADSARA